MGLPGKARQLYARWQLRTVRRPPPDRWLGGRTPRHRNAQAAGPHPRRPAVAAALPSARPRVGACGQRRSGRGPIMAPDPWTEPCWILAVLVAKVW